MNIHTVFNRGYGNEDGFEDLKPRHYTSVDRFLDEITLIRDYLI